MIVLIGLWEMTLFASTTKKQGLFYLSCPLSILIFLSGSKPHFIVIGIRKNSKWPLSNLLVSFRMFTKIRDNISKFVFIADVVDTGD
jgi:hypothetical protein